MDWAQVTEWQLRRLLIHPCPHWCAGNIGLAPAIGVTATSAVPMRTGGNFDQRRLGKGATLYLPVEVSGRAPARAAACCCTLPLALPLSSSLLYCVQVAFSGSVGCHQNAAPQVVGGLLSLGDGHGAMGDGEVSGTGAAAPRPFEPPRDPFIVLFDSDMCHASQPGQHATPPSALLLRWPHRGLDSPAGSATMCTWHSILLPPIFLSVRHRAGGQPQCAAAADAPQA